MLNAYNLKPIDNVKILLKCFFLGVQRFRKDLLGMRDTSDGKDMPSYTKNSSVNFKQRSFSDKGVSNGLRQNLENGCFRSRSVENHGFSQNLHVNYQKLLDENVFLNGEIEKLTREIGNLEKKTEEHKSELMATMTEKHERRIQLVKEEFDFRLEEQRERFKTVEEQAMKERESYKEKVANLEKQLQSLYQANQEVKEGTINIDESKFKELQNEKTILEEQASAALATVAQFSEKHSDLTKKIDSLNQLIKEKDEIIKSTKTNLESTLKKNKFLKSELEAKKKEYESLSTKAYRYTEDLRHTELALHEAKKNQSQLQLKLDTKIAQFESEEKRCTSLMAEIKSLRKRIKSLTCEKNMLSVQTTQYCNVSENAWREVQSVKKESELLRQRLEQQDEIISQLKHMTVRSSRPSFLSNPSHKMNSNPFVHGLPQYHPSLSHCFESVTSENRKVNETGPLHHEKPLSESEPDHCNIKQLFKMNSESDTHSDTSVQAFDKQSTNVSLGNPISLPPHAIEWLKMRHKKKEHNGSKVPPPSSNTFIQQSNSSENANNFSENLKQFTHPFKNNRRTTVTLLERSCTKFPELQKTIERSPRLESASPSCEWSHSKISPKMYSNHSLTPTASSISSYTKKSSNAPFSRSRSTTKVKRTKSISSSTSEDLTECYTQPTESDNEFSNTDGISVSSHTNSTCDDECVTSKVSKSNEMTNSLNTTSKSHCEKSSCSNTSIPSKSSKLNHSYDCYKTQYKNAKGTLLTQSGYKKSHPVVRLIKVQTSQGQCRYELQTSAN
jgi:conjugal transfer/entry exclusion protein